MFLKNSFLIMMLFYTYTISANIENNRIIEINKKGVLYSIESVEKLTDDYVKNIILNEEDTFNAFTKVKDKDGIAIDFGSGIGKATISLAKNFFHVVAVDVDPVSLKYLKNNLNDSQSLNVTICSSPIAETMEKKFFDSKLNRLLPHSHIKQSPEKADDIEVKSITFKKLIHDYIYANEKLKNKKISFINCDIEGDEENILEDLLHFAFYNQCKVYISFHLDRWLSKKIDDFSYLFKFFKTNCPKNNVLGYLERNPFGSILFEPINTNELLIKKNMPIVIIAYNTYTFIKNMVKQLEKFTTDIIVIDNKSNFQPLIDYYKNEFKYTLLYQKTNYGHMVYTKDWIQKLVGDMYIITDPDLKFNSNLPADFIQQLIDISLHFKAHRVGFALSLDNINEKLKTKEGLTIMERQKNCWKNKLRYIKNPNLELYEAKIDTTFCLINRKNIPYSGNWLSGLHIRVAGNFTCVHLPWQKDFLNDLLPGEWLAYTNSSVSGAWSPYIKQQ